MKKNLESAASGLSALSAFHGYDEPVLAPCPEIALSVCDRPEAGMTRRQVLSRLGVVLAMAHPGSSMGALMPSREPPKRSKRQVSMEAMASSADSLDQLHALIIIRGGETVFEKAFRGVSTREPVNIKSVSKTLVATLTGIAVDRGHLRSLDQTLGEVAPDLIPGAADPKTGAITVRHWLSMQTGLQRTSGPFYNTWVNSPNWIDYVLTRPFVGEEGGRMLYSTGNYHVLGAMLTHLTGKSLLTLAREWLGDPLEIQVPPWTRDPQGLYLGGNEMSLSAKGLARFGELHRLGGELDGNRIISKQWIDTAWTARTRSPFSGHAYGLGWYLALVDGHRVAYARGYGGQVLYVIPDLELTVVITSDAHRPARSGEYMDTLHDLLTTRIVPAVV